MHTLQHVGCSRPFAMTVRQCEYCQTFRQIFLHANRKLRSGFLILSHIELQSLLGLLAVRSIEDVMNIIVNLPSHLELRHIASGIALQMTLTPLHANLRNRQCRRIFFPPGVFHKLKTMSQ